MSIVQLCPTSQIRKNKSSTAPHGSIRWQRQGRAKAHLPLRNVWIARLKSKGWWRHVIFRFAVLVLLNFMNMHKPTRTRNNGSIGFRYPLLIKNSPPKCKLLPQTNPTINGYHKILPQNLTQGTANSQFFFEDQAMQLSKNELRRRSFAPQNGCLFVFCSKWRCYIPFLRQESVFRIFSNQLPMGL